MLIFHMKMSYFFKKFNHILIINYQINNRIWEYTKLRVNADVI